MWSAVTTTWYRGLCHEDSVYTRSPVTPASPCTTSTGKTGSCNSLVTKYGGALDLPVLDTIRHCSQNRQIKCIEREMTYMLTEQQSNILWYQLGLKFAFWQRGNQCSKFTKNSDFPKRPITFCAGPTGKLLVWLESCWCQASSHFEMLIMLLKYRKFLHSWYKICEIKSFITALDDKKCLPTSFLKANDTSD